MSVFSPYDAFRIVMEKGEGIRIREFAQSIRDKNESIDRAIVRVEDGLNAYWKQCKMTGEYPVVVSDLNDIIVSSALTVVSLDEQLSTIQSDVDMGNRALLSFYLRTMSWGSFETFCKELLEKLGISDAKLTNRGPDGGIDFTGSCYNPNFREMQFPVVGQAKQWKATTKVTVHEVRELISKLATHPNPAVSGFLITTSTFTEDATKEAKTSKWQMHLWDMGKLVSTILDQKFGLQSADLSAIQVNRPFWDRYIEGV